MRTAPPIDLVEELGVAALVGVRGQALLAVRLLHVVGRRRVRAADGRARLGAVRGERERRVRERRRRDDGQPLPRLLREPPELPAQRPRLRRRQARFSRQQPPEHSPSCIVLFFLRLFIILIHLVSRHILRFLGHGKVSYTIVSHVVPFI